MTELKPCPFCGCPPTKGILSYGEHYVSCTNEDCLIESCASVEDTEEQAIKAWNKRPNPWHTGIPTEEGWYLIAYKYLDGIRYTTDLLIDGRWTFHPPNENVIALQKIEPYKEKEDD